MSYQALELDRFDRKILNILQSDNQVTNQQLAEMVHLSPATCLRRVRALRDGGIISGDIALIDPFRVGRRLVAFIHVNLESLDETHLREFEERMNREPVVMQCYMVASEVDYLVVVNVSDMEEYHDFARRVFSALKNVRRYRSLFAMNRTKFQTKIHFDETAATVSVPVESKSGKGNSRARG